MIHTDNIAIQARVDAISVYIDTLASRVESSPRSEPLCSAYLDLVGAFTTGPLDAKHQATVEWIFAQWQGAFAACVFTNFAKDVAISASILARAHILLCRQAPLQSQNQLER